VEGAEAGHDALADDAAGDLALELAVEFLFDLGDEGGFVASGMGSLPTAAARPRATLSGLKGTREPSFLMTMRRLACSTRS
jgi:hypothetical protein